MLESIARKTLAETVEERLMDFIRMQGLKPGSELPGEIEFAERMGVSRNVVREAVSRLRMLGIVETRKRRGAKVRRPNLLAGFERILNSPLLGDETVMDLFEMRVIIELGALPLFWARKSAEDVIELDRVADLIDAADPLSKKRRDFEEVFHGRILQAVGNNFMLRLRQVLRANFEAEAPRHKELLRYAPAHIPTHRELVDLIKRGTFEEFRDAMTAHVSPYIGMLNAKRAAQPSSADASTAHE